MPHNTVNIRDKFGQVVNPGERHTAQRPWVPLGAITVIVAAGQAPIDVDKRSDADIVALASTEKLIYEPKDGTVNFAVRFRADGTEDDALEVQMLAEAGTDHYMKVADLTCTQGTQSGNGTEKFIDKIAHANKDWPTDPRIVDPQENYIARYILNTHGNSKFLFVCTDLKNATNLYVDVRRLS